MQTAWTKLFLKPLALLNRVQCKTKLIEQRQVVFIRRKIITTRSKLHIKTSTSLPHGLHQIPAKPYAQIMAPNHPFSPFLHHLIVNVQHGCRMAARAFCDTEKRVRRWRRFPRFSPLPVILPRPDCSLHWREAKKEGPSGCIDPGVRKIDSDQSTAWKGEGGLQEYSQYGNILQINGYHRDWKKKIHILESICVGAVLARGHHYSKVVSKCQCVAVGVRMGG